jgi:hypothetical protein
MKNNINKVTDKVMLLMIKANGLDVPGPVPFVNEFVKLNSSEEAQDAWQNIQIELGTLDDKDIETIVRAICMRYFKLSHVVLNLPDTIRLDTMETIGYLLDHSEYRISADEIDPEKIFDSVFDD